MVNENIEHHKRFEYCKNRLKYRQGRHLTAVKVYTVGNESQHLLIFGVPKINLHQELQRKLQKLGKVEQFENITTKWLQQNQQHLQLEQFTDVYRVQFAKIEIARKCKRFMDATEFYGGILHISYAPEYETVEELRLKFRKRHYEVNYRLKMNSSKKECRTGKRQRESGIKQITTRNSNKKQ